MVCLEKVYENIAKEVLKELQLLKYVILNEDNYEENFRKIEPLKKSRD